MKTKERSMKELLIILRDNIKPLFKKSRDNGGMCSVIYDMECHSMLDCNEGNRLRLYLDENIPITAIERKDKFYGMSSKYGHDLASHWWPPRLITPRIKWLNKQINSLT